MTQSYVHQTNIPSWSVTSQNMYVVNVWHYDLTACWDGPLDTCPLATNKQIAESDEVMCHSVFQVNSCCVEIIVLLNSESCDVVVLWYCCIIIIFLLYLSLLQGLDDEKMKSAAIDIFSYIVEFSPSMVREFILQEGQTPDDVIISSFSALHCWFPSSPL